MEGSSRKSRRLTFTFSAHEVTHCEISPPIDMIAPAQGFAPPKEDENSGSWVELRDAHGAVLFQRRVHDPFRRYAEGFKDGGIRVGARAAEPDEFEVIVPDTPNVAAIAVVSSELPPESQPDAIGQAATTIKAFGVAPGSWG